MVSASLSPPIRRKYGGRSALLVLAAIFVILMMGTVPMERVAGWTGTGYTAEFWISSASCPINLGPWIQARFTTDVGTGHLVIKEVDQQNSITKNNNVDGDFMMDEFAQGYYYASNLLQFEYPGVDAEADFRQYKLFASNLTVTAPVYGTNSAPKIFPRLNDLVSYGDNFSIAADQLQILITQNSPPTSTIVPTYTILSGSGTTLKSWTQTWPFPSNDTNPPPYANYGVSDELDGLESVSYAHVLSGTDFQIESVIHPYTATFSGYHDQSYTYPPSVQFTEPPTGGPCFTTWAEDEGTDEVLPSTSTTGTVPGSNEAYQYVEVS